MKLPKVLWQNASRKKRVINLSPLIVSACGSDKSSNLDSQTSLVGDDSLLLASLPLLDKTNSGTLFDTVGSNHEYLLTEIADPYWVKSLEMEQFYLIPHYFAEQPRIIYYAFPQAMPTYFDKRTDEVGWQAVTSSVELATEEILSSIESVINIQFERTSTIEQPFVIAVMSNEQGNSHAYAYFPSTEFSVGSDVFIDNDYLNPERLSENKTNYDYEVVVHELGHALGLKHSFAPLGQNEYFLSPTEDTSRLTAMSYSGDTQYFNADFRPFDYLTLVQFYGINPNFNRSDDTYFFSALGGTYIIDAGGIDTIDASEFTRDAFIDLRENSHSYVGINHPHISSSFQMTISKHSQIENVVGGSGNDRIIGNDLDNYIITGKGDDRVFAGEGRDIIDLGPGDNQVNLYEQTATNDFVVFAQRDISCYSEIYNFNVGGKCDVLVFECDIAGKPNISPILKISEITNFNQYDIYWITDFTTNSKLDTVLYGSSTDKIILYNIDESPDFDTQVQFFDSSGESGLPVLSIATIATNGASLTDWSVENFLLI